jgi:simple sugar transport system ATP-binding protein
MNARGSVAERTDPEPEPAEIAVRMSGIVKSFADVRALDGAGVEVRRGEIHGLLGENGAGKTTLMNILYGLEKPDAGVIEIQGQAVDFRSPKDAIGNRIGMVHQHFMLVSDMTVAENVSLGLRSDRPPLSVVDRVRSATIKLAARYRLEVEPDQVVESMSVGRQQRVELLKLLQRDAEILILDEPTAVLTPGEWEELAGILRVLADEGKSIVLITHKLDEVLAIADRCTVLRDGAPVGTVETRECTRASLATMMVGREVVLLVHRRPRKPGALVLEVDGVGLDGTGHRSRLDDITLDVREGEILGIAGVEGNGQRELEDILTGMVRPSRGRLRIDGVEAAWSTPADFVRAGGAAIPSDRHRAGVALSMSVADNLIVREIGRPEYSRRGIVRRSAVDQYCSELARDYDVRAASLSMPMAQLSGGNQQKAVLARELARAPRLLIAAQPTRGLDIGAIEGVYERLLEHRDSGGATVLISSELEEIRSLSDRIAVMVNGRVLRILAADEADLETIGLLLGGAE